MKLFNETQGRIAKLGIKYPELFPLQRPTARWFGVGGKRVRKTFDIKIRNYIRRCGSDIPVIVLYNIPDRDLGHHSKGGAASSEDYLFFINEVVQGLGDESDTIVIIEPDALAMCGDDYDLLEYRTKLLVAAAKALSVTGAKIYVDIGHPQWHSSDAASRILFPFMGKLDGFSLNVSNYWSTELCTQYAKEIFEQTDLHAVIDTSRNGKQPHNGTWCNPANRRIGPAPTVDVPAEFIDNYLWIKVPGESDGTCNEGPKAGVFWLDQALTLVKIDEMVKEFTG